MTEQGSGLQAGCLWLFSLAVYLLSQLHFVSKMLHYFCFALRQPSAPKTWLQQNITATDFTQKAQPYRGLA